MPFSWEGRAEAVAPEHPDRTGRWWGRPAAFVTRSSPGIPVSLPRAKEKKVDNAQAFSKHPRLVVPARVPGGARFLLRRAGKPPVSGASPPGPGAAARETAPARDPPAAGAAP